MNKKRLDLDVRPIGPLVRNYDYGGPEGGSDVGPGTGLYHGTMDKYKSVSDFLNKSRKRRFSKKFNKKQKKALREMVFNILKKANESSLLSIKVTKDNAEEILSGLLSDVDNIEEAEKNLGIDLRNMFKLMNQFPHNDDLHHNGETVMEHVLQVIEAVDKVTDGKDPLQRQLMGIVALMHDLGKAYTYANKEGKHTFYDHMKRSVDIAEVLLAKHRQYLGDLYHRIIDLIRHHDLFLTMVNLRSESGGNLKYLKPLLRETVYLDGHIDDLLTFSKADSYNAKSYAEKLKDAEGVIEDLAKYKIKQEQIILEKQRQKENFNIKSDEIRALLEKEAPEAADKMPDHKAVNESLGKLKRYDLIKHIQEMIK
jgi:hypothetical protein